MKALDEYFLMVVFTLLLNKVHVFVFANFVSFEQRNMAVKGVIMMSFAVKSC